MVAIDGRGGALRIGYQVAARFGAWRMVRAEDAPRYRIEAALLIADEYWWKYGPPYDLALSFGPREWRWSKVVPTVQDGRMTLMVGAPDEVVMTEGVA